MRVIEKKDVIDESSLFVTNWYVGVSPLAQLENIGSHL